MDSLLSVNPGLLIWTMINFGIFLFLMIKFGGKAMTAGLKAREDRIRDQIEGAEAANAKAVELLKESQAKIDSAQGEVAAILTKGKEQAEAQIRKASEEADKVKKEKLADTLREIERSKEAALKELRTEVAGLVVDATEKILGEKLDGDKDVKMINSYIEKLPKN